MCGQERGTKLLTAGNRQNIPARRRADNLATTVVVARASQSEGGKANGCEREFGLHDYEIRTG